MNEQSRIPASHSEHTWSDYVGLLRRRWRPTTIAALAIALGIIYIAYTLPPLYESSATILIEEQGIPTDYVQTTVNAYEEQLLQTIYQRVVATANVLDFVEKFDLYPEERTALPEDELIELFRDHVDMAPQNVTTVHARTGRETIVTYGFETLFRYPDASKARDVAQEIAERFVSSNSDLRKESAARTTAFLDSESRELEDQLARVAEKIAEFKELNANNLPEDQDVNLRTWERLREELTGVEQRLRETRELRTILAAELVDIPRFRPVIGGSEDPVLGGVDRLAEAQQELIRLRGRYSEEHPEIIRLRREISILGAGPGNQASLAERLRSDLEIRRQELALARNSYSENHPDVVRLREQVNALEAQLRETQASGQTARARPNNPAYIQQRTRISTADAEIADLSGRRVELDGRVTRLDRLRAAAPQVEREYSELTQERELLLERYRELRGMGSEAALGEALETGQSGARLTIVEPARIPSSPVSPNRISLSFLGIVLALAIGLGIASLTEAMDTTVRGKQDIEDLLDMPPIGIIPLVENSKDAMKRRTANLAMGIGAIGAFALVFSAVLTS